MATAQVLDELANYESTAVTKPDLDSDTLKAVLTNTAPTKAGSQVLADITQIAGTGGYAAVTLTGVTYTESGAGTGIWVLTCNPFSWTASGAAFATACYAVIYDDTPTNPADPLICYIDYGSSVALAQARSASPARVSLRRSTFRSTAAR